MSGCLGFEFSSAPNRGQNVKQKVCWECTIFNNGRGSAEVAGVGKLIQGGKRTADDPLWKSSGMPPAAVDSDSSFSALLGSACVAEHFSQQLRC